MREISLFVEDYGHEQVVGSLVHWLAHEEQVNVRLTWWNTRHGFGRVADEFKEYLRDLRQQGGPAPDLIVVATDANCKGLNERAREFRVQDAPAPITLAMPDPHVERWLLLDGAAFRAVFGVGCDAPDLRCSRDRYKTRLLEAIRNAGVTPNLGGLEFAEDIVHNMDINRVARSDRSFARFVDELRRTLHEWR